MTDAIVIGSGPNGLAAAIRLAAAGREVLVLEAADTPGGAVRSEQLTLPGFVHDTFSAVHPAAAASPVFERMGLERHGLRWTHPTACMAHPVDGGPAGVLHHDLDRTAASLNDLAPGDGDRWREWAQPLVDAYPALRRTMFASFPPLDGPVAMLRQAGPLRTATFGALVAQAAERFAKRILRSPDSRAWLIGTAMHSDAPPFRAGSAIAAAHLQLLGHAVGWPSPQGGAGALSRALVEHLAELGGRLRTGTRVDAILATGGRVTGVRTADGTENHAPIVIADVMPGALVRLAGPALGRWYRAALGRYRPGPATLKLDWALAGPIPWSDPTVGEAGTVHLGGSEDELLRSQREAEAGFSQRPFMLLGQQTIADPTRAPVGRHTAWAYTHAAHDIDWSEAACERYVARMEAQVERFAPGFRDLILARHVLTPADLERRNPNLVGGDVGGGSYRLDQLIFRPLPKANPYATPIKGLFLGSAATFPGGAVHGVCGDAAARAALRGADRVRGAGRLPTR